MLDCFVSATPAFIPIRDKTLEGKLRQINYKCSASQYVTFAVLFSLFIFLPFVFFLLAALLFSLSYVALLAPGCFLFFYFYPQLQIHLLKKQINSQLPLLVHAVYIELAAGVNREKALMVMNEFPLFLPFYQRCQRLLVSGIPFELLPNAFATTAPSVEFIKFLQKLATGKASELKKFHVDLLEEQRNSAKRGAAKANLTGMFFIAISAVVPAMFAAVVLLGNVLGFAFSSLQVIVVFVFIFPLFDLALLYYMQLNSAV
ncbi:MAG: hypothetical protein V1722_00650 [Candidatus Micrarchaeota archaeon]